MDHRGRRAALASAIGPLPLACGGFFTVAAACSGTLLRTPAKWILTEEKLGKATLSRRRKGSTTLCCQEAKHQQPCSTAELGITSRSTSLMSISVRCA